MAHVSPEKKELVEKLVEEFSHSQVVGVVNVQGIPAAQFQKMRRKLRNKVNLKVVKNNLLAIALEQASDKKAGLDKLRETIEGQTAVVTANVNPFKLFKEMEATKTKAPAKGGEVAPEDIWIMEGETPFKPGPIVGDLQKAGIPAAIERGKVVVKKDKLLVSKGDKIPRVVAMSLTRLEIFPVIVGLDLRGAYEDGMVYTRDVLAVDEVKLVIDIQTAALRAFNLSVNIAYPTRTTIEPLIHTAHSKALSLAVHAGFMTKESIPFILAKAKSQMLALASAVDFTLGEKPKETVPEAPPREEPPKKKVAKEVEKKEEKKEKKKSKKKAEKDSSSTSKEKSNDSQGGE